MKNLIIVLLSLALGLYILDSFILTKRIDEYKDLYKAQDLLNKTYDTTYKLQKSYIGNLEYVIKNIPRVDLPEEYMEMSHNSSKPDTLLGFYDNDTVYITFTGNHR